MTNQEPKMFWESKTLIFNVVLLLSVVMATMVSENMFSESILKWVVIGQALVNSVLRLITDRPLGFRKE